jgi:hypothetical protein
VNCFSKVICVIKVLNVIRKWWSLKTGGRYLEVVISSGLTLKNDLGNITTNFDIQSNSVITNSSGPDIFVRYNRDSL